MAWEDEQVAGIMALAAGGHLGSDARGYFATERQVHELPEGSEISNIVPGRPELTVLACAARRAWR